MFCKTFTKAVTAHGWEQSEVDKCLYRLYEMKGKKKVLIGLLSALVGDCFCCGTSTYFESRVKLLQAAFPFGQWVCAMDHPNKYCGTTHIQYPDYSVHTHQFDYVAGLEVITLPGSKNL